MDCGPCDATAFPRWVQPATLGWGRRAPGGAGTTAFFDPADERVAMQPIREALRNLPDAVFADLLESSDAYLLVLDLPGVKKEGVTVNAYERRLEIEASREKTVPRGFEYLDEERSLFLDTTVPLPMDAVAEDATATLEDGVLEITIPRAEHAGRDIPIEG